MKIIFITLVVQISIMLYVERACRRNRLRFIVRRHVFRLQRCSVLTDPLITVYAAEGILWQHSIDPVSCGIDSVETLHDLVGPALKRYKPATHVG